MSYLFIQLAVADICTIELKEEIEDYQFKILIRDEEIKKLEFKNELTQRIIRKNEQMHNDVTGTREERENSLQDTPRCLKELEEKTELLKQYKVKVSTNSVVHSNDLKTSALKKMIFYNENEMLVKHKRKVSCSSQNKPCGYICNTF